MTELRTLKECATRQEAQVQTYAILYHRSRKRDDATVTEWYWKLCHLARARLDHWLRHPPVNR